MAPPRWVSNLDAFRSVPQDLAEASATGAGMTLVAFITCSVLFLCEFSAFISAKPRTDVLLDSNQDAMLRINFDVTMLDMACDHVTVGVWDAFGTERMNITSNVQKQKIDHKGKNSGRSYTEDELVELEYHDRTWSKEELSELDSDWSSSSDQFKHSDFESVIDAHDFTFVNFYADWCPHCMQFSKPWGEFETKLNSGEDPILDADGVKANVRALKVNCVDFEETCQEQKIQAFPSVRLYRRGADKKKAWVDFRGPRQIEALSSFAKSEVKKRHMHTGAHFHDIFKEGCRIAGYVEVARVPGTVHFQAMHSSERTLNLAYTNVSHEIHHFSFGEGDPKKAAEMLPAEYRRNAAPLDGKKFLVGRFHQAPQHFIKVVHTKLEQTNQRTYQQTHQWSVRTVQRKTIPQAKFSYDLSPVEVVVRQNDRRWYDFITSIFAIIGGAFTVMSMTSGMLNVASKQFKGSLGKLG
mmetsp:Transcript_49209/g.107090  ORF Transcript_49209/g.107090 Transcript_49209/m.107090 type:complete len:467 (+) Transcript_49209:2-1402(+)